MDFNMKKMLVLSLLVVTLFISGCDQKEWFNKFIPKEETEFSKNQIEFLQQKDFVSLREHMNSSLKEQGQLQEGLNKLALFFPNEKPKSVEVVGANSNTFTSGGTTTKRTDITLQYEFSNKWLLAAVSVYQENDGSRQILGINIQPTESSLAELNRFTFSGKGIIHYLILLATIAVPLFIIYTLVLCVKTPIPKRKWLWVVFILFGVCGITLNWTTGDFSIQPLNFQILGSGFFKSGPYAPVMISTSFPLGAIIFLFKRKKYKRV